MDGQLTEAVKKDRVRRLMEQVEYLTSMLFSQLGINQAILDGTADEKTMLNYNTRTVAPILVAITEEMTRKFLTKTARTQGQRVKFVMSPFKMVPISQIADFADKFIRAEAISSNELRSIIGFMPVDSPQADELRNSNLNRAPFEEAPASTNPEVNQMQMENPYGGQMEPDLGYENQNEQVYEEPEPEPQPTKLPPVTDISGLKISDLDKLLNL